MAHKRKKNAMQCIVTNLNNKKKKYGTQIQQKCNAMHCYKSK